jgi:hypothetical protein
VAVQETERGMMRCTKRHLWDVGFDVDTIKERVEILKQQGGGGGG